MTSSPTFAATPNSPAPEVSTTPATPPANAETPPVTPTAPVTPETPPAVQTPPATPNAPPATPETPPATPPATPETPPVTPPPGAEFKVPDEYKDKPWAAKVKSLDDLFKQVDTLDALKGKKTIVPDLKAATPEEREAFYAQLRPKDASEYVFMENPALPMQPEVKAAVGEMLLKSGVSAIQGNEIIKAYQEMSDKQMAKMFDPADYEKSMETAFGKDWKPITGTVRNTIKGMMSPDDNKLMDNIPNAYLGIIYRTLGNVVQKFGVKETDTAHFQGPGTHAQTDIESVRSGIRNEMLAMSNRPHDTKEIMALRDKLAQTYENDPRLQETG